MLRKKDQLLELLRLNIGARVNYRVLSDSKPIKATLVKVDEKFAYLKFSGKGSRKFGTIATLPHKVELVG